MDLPCLKLCIRWYPFVLRVLKPSVSIFQRVCAVGEFGDEAGAVGDLAFCVAHSALSRRVLRPSICEARLAISEAAGSIRKRVLLPIRCKQRNYAERCQPSQRSRRAHFEDARLPTNGSIQQHAVAPSLRSA